MQEVSCRFRACDFEHDFELFVRKHADIEYNVQQDAQEFLLWLLDQLHEDMREGNRRSNMARQSFRKIKSLG